MKETMYIFRIDSQYRIPVPVVVRELYGFEKDVYIKLQVIDDERYIQISGREIDFYHLMSKLDSKGRFILPKEAREKFDVMGGDKFDSYEEEIDSNNRSLLLKKRI